MKIIAITDLHGNIKPIITYLKDNKVDLIIIAGDITNFGPPKLGEDLLNEISSFGVPVLAIPGNCDPESIHVNIDQSQAINIHARNMVIKNIGICGFGGSNPTPFDTPLEFEEIQIYDEAKKAINGIENEEITLFITHAPPYGTKADLLPSGAHVGSKSLRKVIEEMQPTLNICGHIHEARGTDKIGKTTIVNPGELSHGYACLIQISDSPEDKEVETELIQL
ncbi:metallophosphoesterase [Methanobacterium formicicum]|uniref:Metallophosphoesterase n=1 Tax=Methanobacterium formicicum (strain DSM 3637 / PP1) TaxID=1204725 RepID=K2QDG3_METFP|nr:metallophosphoesterase [Methanobacterium formicicum]EKF86071.1 metallophosphoesterase [Methanobacterium formicicum DSM 3637]